MRRKRVLHISTAHHPYDPRIVYKQCPALADEYEVYCALPYADASVAPQIRFIRLPRFRHVLLRLLLTTPYVLLRTVLLRPAVVHIYMPDLLPLAFLFHWMGSKVVYEVQENIYKKFAIKRTNRAPLFQRFFRWLDEAARRHFYLIFTEHAYLQTYINLSKAHAVIYNYPDLSFYEPFRVVGNQPCAEPYHFFFIGGISFERAIDTMITGLSILKKKHLAFQAHLFGPRYFPMEELSLITGYGEVKDNLRFYGYTDQQTALPVAGKSLAGLALIKPVADYPDSYTTKMFEYMALGLPVITANFPLYEEVVKRHQCGFCLDPYDPQAFADALCFLIENPAESRAMGERGRAAAEAQYNWESEKQKLLRFYENIAT